MWSWYPDNIKGDNIKYPDASGTNVSETWALGTREIAAWDSASSQIMALSGASSAIWGLNLALGQTGNTFHRIFYLTSTIFRLTPLVMLYHALYIQRQYLPNGSVY